MRSGGGSTAPAQCWDAIKNPAAAGCCFSLFLDRDRVCHRTAVKLSFARAYVRELPESVNYRQLPVRERPPRSRRLPKSCVNPRYRMRDLASSDIGSLFLPATAPEANPGLLQELPLCCGSCGARAAESHISKSRCGHPAMGGGDGEDRLRPSLDGG